MSGVKISVIIPVYNVAGYVKECIESLLAQSFTDFEIIMVDDGSTDNSGDICDSYALIDNRIRVIHRENEGPSIARNVGLDVANGEYICFVDSDDSVRSDYLEKLYSSITRKNADIVICDADSDRLGEFEVGYTKEKLLSKNEAWNWLYDNISREYTLMVVVWNKIYARRIFEKLRFPGDKIHEDDYMANKLLLCAEKIVFLPERLYMYRYNASGITGSDNKSDVRHVDFVDAYFERIQIAIDEDRREFAARTLKNGLIKLVQYYRFGGEIANASRSEYRRMYGAFSYLLSFKQRLKYGVFICNPKLALLIIK